MKLREYLNEADKKTDQTQWQIYVTAFLKDKGVKSVSDLSKEDQRELKDNQMKYLAMTSRGFGRKPDTRSRVEVIVDWIGDELIPGRPLYTIYRNLTDPIIAKLKKK